MSSRRLIQKQLSICLLLLIYLLSALLPAGTAYAVTPGKGCENKGAQAAGVAPIAITYADEKVTIPKEKVDLAVFNANWRYNLDDAHIGKYMIMGVFDMYYDKIDPTVGNEFWDKFYEKMDKQIEAYSQEYQFQDNNELIVHAILDLALDTPEVAPAVPYVWRRLMAKAVDSEDFGQRIGESAQLYNLGDRLLEISPEILAAVYECATDIPAVAQAFDTFHRKLFPGGSILDDAKTILEKNPDLPIPAEIKDGIEEDGTLDISLNDLKDLEVKQFTLINDSIDEMQKTLSEIDEQQDKIVDYLQDQEKRAKLEDKAKKEAAEHELKLKAISASITALTSIVGQLDPVAAKNISIMANSYIQIGTALHGWIKATAGLKGLDKVASLSTVVMTGNIIGAVMNIVSLFRTGAPTPEEMILEEIGKLRHQVDEVRVQMHDRFDRVDLELNTIFTTMHDRFNQIDLQLGKINGNIQEVQQSLVTIDLKLSRIEQNNFEFLNALGRRPLLEAINGGLGYEERTGSPMPYEPQFVDFENQLQSWGTIHAYDPLNAGPTNRDYSDAGLLAELNAYPIDSNLNYLNGWLIAHGLPGISDKQLASPRDWLFASRAYTQLGLEWPEHMRRIDPLRQTELDRVGDDLEEAMRNIASLQTVTGTVGNTLLFSSVVTTYQGNLNQVNKSIEALEKNYVSDLQVNRLQRSDAFNLYGGVNQPVNYASPELTAASCGNPAGYGSYPLMGNLKPLIPNYDLYNLADYLRVGKLSVCLSDQWYDQVEDCHSDPDFPGQPPVCYLYATHHAILSVNFDGALVMKQTIIEPNYDMPYEGADRYTRDNWTLLPYYEKQFGDMTTIDVPTPEEAAQQAELLAATTNKVENALAGYQQQFYGQVINEMTQGSLTVQASEVAGSKMLLDNFATLGLPRAVSNDEFLHAMLFGNQQLVEQSQIVQSYAISATEPVTDLNVLVNPRDVISNEALERVNTFAGMVKEYLDAITAQRYAEAPDYLENTHRAFDLTMRIAQMDLPLPDDGEGGDEVAAIAGLQASANNPTQLGKVTRFAATITQGSQVSYQWEFGDGTTGTGANTSHTYAALGHYAVRLTARNTLGEATAELEVVVEVLPSGQTSPELYMPSLSR